MGSRDSQSTIFFIDIAVNIINTDYLSTSK